MPLARPTGRIDEAARKGPESFLSLGIVFLSSLLISFIVGSQFLNVGSEFAQAAQANPGLTTLSSTAASISIATTAQNNILYIPFTPSATGTFGSGDITVSVDTDNATGYTLSMSTASTQTALTGPGGGTVPALSTSATLNSPSVIPVNSWGFWRWLDSQASAPTADSSFASVPPLGTPVILRETATAADPSDTTLTFAAKADLSKPAGIYQNRVVFTAVANEVSIIVPPDPGTSLGALQNLTYENCPSYTESLAVRTAFDARNDQIYYVGEVANACWMMTNLRYAGDGTWDARYGYPDDRKTITHRYSGQSTNTAPEYFDPGYNSDDYTDTDPQNGFYGYLYNWCAAMGGQQSACNTSSYANDLATSICPAGWRLPEDYDIYDLEAEINSTVFSDYGLVVYWLAVYSGSYLTSFYGQTEEGSYWSSTLQSPGSSYAIEFYVSPNDVNPYSAQPLYAGLAVRCILKAT